MPLLADYALNVTLVSLFIWVVLFPVLVQGLIVYAVILAGARSATTTSRTRGRKAQPLRPPRSSDLKALAKRR